MSDLADKIRDLVLQGDYEISEHGAARLLRRGVLIEPFTLSIEQAVVVEVNPGYHKGPCVLFLDHDEFGAPIHLLWGIPLGAERPAYLITVYRPDPARWLANYLIRRTP